jgi:hypothetical protein
MLGHCAPFASRFYGVKRLAALPPLSLLIRWLCCLPSLAGPACPLGVQGQGMEERVLVCRWMLAMPLLAKYREREREV